MKISRIPAGERCHFSTAGQRRGLQSRRDRPSRRAIMIGQALIDGVRETVGIAGDPSARARGLRHVGRRRFDRDGGTAEACGLRCRRHHAAALRPWRGGAAQGGLLRGPGHSRCAARRGRPRHSALRARFRIALQGGGDRRIRDELSGGRDADPLRHLQPDGQVRRPAAALAASSTPRCWRRGIMWRAGRGRTAPAGATCSRPPTWRATRAISCSPPPSRSSTTCAFRWAR